MRIYLKTTKNTAIVSFEYQQKMIGVIHKWLGNNEMHDKISLYSFSWLMNGRMIQNKGYDFPEGATLFISFYENIYLNELIKSILIDPNMFCGMSVTEVTIADQPVFNEGAQRFRLASPILIKRAKEVGGRESKFYLFKDDASNAFMTETLKHKMQEAGLPEDESLRIEFDLSYLGKQEKMVQIHGIKNKASMCPVVIHGRPETKLFAWTVGVGNSTGSSFGSLL